MKTTTVYGASPIRRQRRTKEEIRAIRAALYRLLAASHPMTVRQTFYRLVTLGVIAKTEGEYKSTVCRLLAEMRKSEIVPYHWIADNTRWQRKPTTHSSLDAALQRAVETYRRALWDDQGAYVEIWTEKDALAGVLYDVTATWDVPLMVSRGFSSLSYLYEAAKAISAQKKPAYIYFFGDHDPSGLEITRHIQRELRRLAPRARISFHRVAVTPEQITAWNLPTRPTKQTDSRSRGFDGDSVEVDAIPTHLLRELAETCITQHVNAETYDMLRKIEEQERAVLKQIQAHLKGAA